ncbi:Opioid growth factor receptor [Labeo rohita]|uniref:Opioid growth factor receptor n=1 Tax=Labeo rohita TaxID=84645 RepID=A0ABQ8MZ97_LABRO|nr:Opioid growth factor receptor [Labeo rohita]
MASLLCPEFILLRLKQGDLQLEGYTIMFQLIANTTSYPDDVLCAFYDASLNASCRVPSSEDSPRADFATFVEWTLARNKPSSPACSLENLASATPDPEPSQPPPRHAEHEHEPEPTADGSHATSATQEPSPIGATERTIATELEEFASDQVREPATIPAMVDVPDGREGAEDSTAHCTTAEGEQRLDYLPDCLDFPPTLPLSIVSAASVPPPLSPGSPSAHPQLTICAVGLPQVCQSPSVLWLEDPSSAPPASESWTPPRPSDPAAPPRLSAPSSPPSPVGPPAPPGSIIPPAPPWSVVAPPSPLDSTPPAAPRHSIPPALWTSSLPRAQPRSSVAPAPPRTSGSPPPPRSPEPWAPPGPSGSSVLPRIIGSPSPPRALPPPALPPSVGPMESPAFPPPWLLPPSAPPWGSIMAAVWVSPGSSCSSPLLSPPWLLPPSSPPWNIPSSPWTPSFALLPGVRPPPKPPPKTLYILLSLFVGARTRLPGGGGNVTPLDFLVGFSHYLPCSSVCFSFSLIIYTCVWVSSVDWGVSYSHSHICALKNSSVIMSCTYKYPAKYKINKAFWNKTLVKDKHEEFPDLLEDPKAYPKGFNLQVESPERVTEGDSVRLTCKSSCTLTDRATFIWYRNSQPLTERRDRNNELLLQSVRREDAGRYSRSQGCHLVFFILFLSITPNSALWYDISDQIFLSFSFSLSTSRR